ncbi:MAG: glycosyltransferase [Gammaproteobacteria bacterium]
MEVNVGAYYADLMADIEPLLSAVDICCPSTASLDLASSWPWSRGISFPMPGDTTQRVRLPHVPTLTRHIHKFRPDVIVSATPGGYGIMAAHIGRQLGVKVFAGFHTCFTQIARLYWRRWRCLGARGLSLACHHVLFSMADEVLVNSPDMMRLAREHGARRVRLVGTPVTPKYLSTPVRRLPTSVEKVLFVGRLAAEKNIEAVVRAAISLPHMQFSFVGDGPERRKLERISRSLPNVRLHGWVDRSAMDRVLDDHDVLVLPSRIESFGTVALEAMARQRLVIVSPACGITEWPCLRGGLRVMDPQETLTEALIDVSRLNAFGLFSQGALARAAVRQHVLWNRRLWSTALVEPVQAWSRSAVWRACARDMLTGWL